MPSRENPDPGDPFGSHGGIVQFSPGATILIDRDGTIVAANTLAGGLLARTPSELEDQPSHPQRVGKAQPAAGPYPPME